MWKHLNICFSLKKIDFEVIGAFLGPFLGIDTQKTVVGGSTFKEVGELKKFFKTTYDILVHSRIFSSAVRPKLAEISLKTFDGFFCPHTVSINFQLKKKN